MKKLFALSLIALLWATSTVAQPPTTIAYQGSLGTAAGTPLNETVSVQFKLYDTLTGGSALWSETKSVQVTNGKFSVELGTTSPLIDQLFGQPMFLRIQVAADGEMTPRLNLTSTPYAFRARSLLRNTIHVAQDGTPEQAGAALQAAVSAAGIAAVAGTPMSIELDAGTFMLASALSLPSFVHVHGQGRDATIVQAVESGANSSCATPLAGEGAQATAPGPLHCVGCCTSELNSPGERNVNAKVVRDPCGHRSYF